MITSYVGVKGLVVKDNTILLLRGTNKGRQFIDIPGGRMDNNESLHETLMRELTEELPGITDIRIGDLIFAKRVPGFPFGDKALTLIYYAVEANTDAVAEVSHEHDEIFWWDLNGDTKELDPRVGSAVEQLKKLHKGN